jgi:hypothetical protein
VPVLQIYNRPLILGNNLKERKGKFRIERENYVNETKIKQSGGNALLIYLST